MCSSDLSPSRSEPLGRVLFEALDAGTPVLATRTQGPTEILARLPGTLVPIDDVTAMAAALSAAQRAPRVRCAVDLTPWHLDNVARETLAAYEALRMARTQA